MQISLIIPVYKNITFLDMIIESLKKQSYKNFELIITEDAENIEMRKFICEKKKEVNFDLIHISQEDRGFRKNKALNNALKIAKGDLLIFVDGDCILHYKFIEEYKKAYNEGDCFIGRRQELGINFTKKIIELRKVKFSIFDIIFSDSNRKEFRESIYLLGLKRKSEKLSLLGSNYGVKKEILIKINGFDEDYTGYGWEDCDLEWRLRKVGAKFISMKGRAIQYHMWHPENMNEGIEGENNRELFNKKIEINNYICKNGLEKLED